MSKELTVSEHNAETGEIIERLITEDEIAKAKADAKAAIENKAAIKAKKQEVLDRLGITADEAALLLG